MPDIHKRRHHFSVEFACDGRHSGVTVALPHCYLSADLPCVSVGTRHHPSGIWKRFIRYTLACHASQRLAIMQLCALFSEYSVHCFKASAVYSNIGSHHKGIGLVVDGQSLSKIFHGFRNVPFIHRADKTNHIRVGGKLTDSALFYRNNAGAVDLSSNDFCGIQAVARTAEAVDDLFHKQNSLVEFVICHSCNPDDFII